MKKKIWRNKGTRGAILLESLIVYPVTVFLLFFVFAIFSVMFQRWSMQIVANDAAARMAQTYRLNDADDISGYVTEEQLLDVKAYRYIGKKMEKSISERVSEYAVWRLQNSTFAKSVSAPVITTVVHPDSLGRRHIEVTIKGKYAVPFGTVLTAMGFENFMVYEAKAYAECVDMIDYINFVEYVDAQTNLNGTFIKLIDSVLSLFDNIFND